MSDDPLQLAICSSTKSPGPISLSLPSIDQITLPDFTTLKRHVTEHSSSHSFILLFMDIFDENSNKILEDLKKTIHIFAIYIRVKRKCHLTIHSENVFPVAKQFIAKKIASSIIRFYEILADKLLKENRFFAAMNYKRKVNTIKDQRRSSNITIDACHLLIIPMNVKEDHLYECQEELINICNDICGEYEPTVCVLYDYFPSDDDFHLYGNNENMDFKCKFIKKIAPMRFYLFGNEPRNLHSLSRYLFKSESDKIDDEYDTNYTMIEYESVTEQSKQFLMYVCGYARQQQPNFTLKRLEVVKNHIKFAGALERVNVDIRQRARDADIELNQQAMSLTNDSIECSGVFHIITQAPNGPVIQNSGVVEEIDNVIQYNLTQSFPD